MTGDGGEAKSAVGGSRKPAQEVLDVRLVTRALAAEHIGVHDDEFRHASSR
jgi:hypothetical protein